MWYFPNSSFCRTLCLLQCDDFFNETGWCFCVQRSSTWLWREVRNSRRSRRGRDSENCGHQIRNLGMLKSKTKGPKGIQIKTYQKSTGTKSWNFSNSSTSSTWSLDSNFPPSGRSHWPGPCDTWHKEAIKMFLSVVVSFGWVYFNIFPEVSPDIL